MKFTTSLILFFFLITTSLIAQTNISGKVIDADSGEPLPGVNVYISGTTIGASTDNNGQYQFNTDIVGRQDIVASFVGFKTQIKSFLLGEHPTLEHNVSLAPKVLELNEIKVVASNNEFLRQLDLFTTFFIGFDRNADQTTIINPEVLVFTENESSDRITVEAGEPLIIQNNALGYTYEVTLRDAYFNPTDNTGLYKIYPRVIEMEPRNRREQRRWNSNRKESYDGSSRHFFKSVVDDKVTRNKFRIYPSARSIVNYSDSVRYLQNWFPNNWEFVKQNFKVYQLSADFARIEYSEINNSGYGVNITAAKVSGFEVKDFPEIFVINDQGLLLNSQRVTLYGEWSNSRFSDFLPLDYSN